MSAERLREILNNVADETRPVPLEVAAMAESRRIGVRRTVIGAAAAAVLLVAGVVGATAVWSDRGAPPVDPAISESPTSPVPNESPNMKGTRLYYIDDNDGLQVLIDNRELQSVLTNEPGLAASANFSNDGRWLSWVTADSEVKLRDMNTGEVRVIIDDYGDDLCQEPVWSVNSYQLFVKVGGEWGFYDVGDDAFTPLSFGFGDDCHVQFNEWPGQGDPAIQREYFVVDWYENTITVFDDNGQVTAEADNRLGENPAGLGADLEILGMRSHADGEYYCLVTSTKDAPLGDFGRSPDCDTYADWDGETFTPLYVKNEGPTGDPSIDATVTVREPINFGESWRFVEYQGADPVWSEPEYPGLTEWSLLYWGSTDE
ncbi:hypothetical protein [Phytomonospora endophytica]|uniref:Uncharacterized protein n=1 Tax=Phytomonospora endophytica TaxID=714109 RepID=A0A841FTX6_9ACTN|nr:hypothetical protein [Phytomonospora endophytica]MBB6039795.1 hypothetical protein [Phytomonospora endophytica]GIG70350.1 hypothetical protein Pen01_66450 [Phytomonospora endophytica]